MILLDLNTTQRRDAVVLRRQRNRELSIGNADGVGSGISDVCTASTRYDIDSGVHRLPVDRNIDQALTGHGEVCLRQQQRNIEGSVGYGERVRERTRRKGLSLEQRLTGSVRNGRHGRG